MDKTISVVSAQLTLQKGGGGGCFPKIPIMRHYQGVTQTFWEDYVLKNDGKNNLSKSSLSQHVMWFPNTAGIHGTLYRA